jgi:prophage tail gpP-like protein
VANVPQFYLSVNSVLYSEWTKLSITKSLEQLAHSYSVALTDKWTAQKKPVPVKRGNAVDIVYESIVGKRTTVSRGWINKPTLKYSATERERGFTGRSRTCDLVDCSAIYQTGTWAKTGLLQIALDLCKPFGIAVSVLGGTVMGAPFGEFTLNDGETVFEALERGARQVGVVMTTDGEGDLVFAQTGATKVMTVLQRGKNILECDSSDSDEERFSEYHVKAQSAAGGLDGETYSSKQLTQKAVSKDPDILRYRPTIIQAETTDSRTTCVARANWEAAVRAGRGNRVSYLVDGWEHSQGLWEPNTLVHVVDDAREIDTDLLVVSVNYTRSNEDGTHTRLELTFKEAFVPQPLQAVGKTKGGNPLRG